MTLHRYVISIALLTFSGSLTFAGSADKKGVSQIGKVSTVEHYGPFLINNIFNYYGNNGDGSYNKYLSDGALEFTKGSGKTMVFQDGIVWGGFHKGRENPKVGGSAYRHALQPGRIITPGGPTEPEAAIPDDPMKPEYRVLRVRPDVSPSKAFADVQAVLSNEASLVARYEPSVTAQTLYDAYVKDWNEWPAKTAGNPAGLAPFADLNGNGTYEPGVDIPGEPGASQTLYYVANDLNPSLTQYLAGCPPIGLEMHRTFWGYTTAGFLSNTIFSRSILINKSGAPIDSMFLVQWSDPDLGNSDDDFVGCDATRDLGFVYNGLPTDAVYGKAVPAAGYELLQGPVVPSPGDSALFRMGYRHGYRNLGMTAFDFFSQGFAAYADPVQGPNGDIQWYRLMNGLTAPAGIPFINPVTGQPTKFCVNGDPVTAQGWLDGMAGLTPQDRRMCLITGPFQLANGDTQEVVTATLAGLGGDRISSVAVLKWYADQLRAFYGSLQHKVPPTCAAGVTYTSGDSASITFHIDASAERLEAASGNLKDSLGMLIPGILFFDDGTHGDSLAGDQVFTNQVTVARTLRPLSLDVITTSNTTGTTTWPKLLPAITVAGPVTVSGPIIFSDNINSDGQPNFGENIRFGISTTNSTPFPLRLYITSIAGEHSISSLPAGETNAMEYDPENPADYFATDMPRSPADSICKVAFSISDTLGNVWSGEVRFQIQSLADTIKTALLAHPAGTAYGSFDVSVLNKSELRNHLYVIRGVDAIDSLGQSGFTLKDSTDGRVLLLNHPLPDSLGHNIPVTDGFKVLRGSIDRGYGYKTYEIPHGTRVWSWVNGSTRRLEGFGGAIGAAWRTWYTGSTVDLPHVTSVLIRFAGTDEYGNLLSSSDTLASYAYRYVRGASAGPQRAEFAPFITNTGQGYAYQDYNHNLPFAAYDLGKNPPTRLMVGYIENNQVLGSVDGKYWPPLNSDTVDNVRGDGPREWFFIFNAPYSTTPSPTFQVDLLSTTVPMMWYGTPTRRSGTGTFHAGDELIIRAFMPPTSNDVWTFNPEIVVSVDERTQPQLFALLQNYPNPFNPKTVISSQLPVVSNVRIVIYDLLGREVKVLVNERRAAGCYEDSFDGSGLASGMYIYRFTAGTYVQSRKMLLLK